MKVNYDHPDSLETELLIQHIHHLRAGTAIDLPVYDYKLHTRAPETVRIEPKPIILVEGILIFAEPSLRKLFDMKLFVDTEQELCLSVACKEMWWNADEQWIRLSSNI